MSISFFEKRCGRRGRPIPRRRRLRQKATAFKYTPIASRPRYRPRHTPPHHTSPHLGQRRKCMAWTASPRPPPNLSVPRSCALAPCMVLRTLSESRGCLPRAVCAFSQTKVAKLIRSHWSTYSPESLAYPQADGNSMTRERHLARGWHQSNRHRGDSSPCGQSPINFESISLTARTQCHAPKQERLLKRLVEFVMRAHPADLII
jgi:hypothetical protein